MKILKRILLAIVVLIAFVLIAAIILPKDYAVQREVTINKPVGEVFSYVVLLKNQDNFSVWAQMDPKMKKSFTGTDGNVGFVSAWESTNQDVGKGEQEIVGIIDNKRIEYKLRFFEPFETEDDAFMQLSERAVSETLVTWGFSGKMPIPMNLMLLFIDMENQLGPDLQNGLNNLKAELES